MNLLSKKHPMNDGVIIVLSSISSTATYIFIDKILSHLEHPSEVFILATGLIVMFVCISYEKRLYEFSFYGLYAFGKITRKTSLTEHINMRAIAIEEVIA